MHLAHTEQIQSDHRANGVDDAVDRPHLVEVDLLQRRAVRVRLGLSQQREDRDALLLHPVGQIALCNQSLDVVQVAHGLSFMLVVLVRVRRLFSVLLLSMGMLVVFVGVRVAHLNANSFRLHVVLCSILFSVGVGFVVRVAVRVRVAVAMSMAVRVVERIARRRRAASLCW